MKHFYVLLLFILLGLGNVEAQQRTLSCGHQHVPGKACPGIMGLPENIDAFTPPPANYQPGVDRAVNIQVTYNGFTPQAQQAFQYAVDIWASLLTSDVTILVDATWEDIPGNTLGFAGATGYYPNVPGEDPNVYFPSALADKLAGFDLGFGDFDIEASFDSGTDWYFGLDGNTPNNQYDFVSVVLHELGHGLGVAGTGTVSGNDGFIGFSGNSTPAIYDIFVEDVGGTAILDYIDGTVALGNALTSNGLYWNGASGVAVGNTEPRLYAPGVWEQGSSYSHLNEDTYVAGNINSLMTPFIANSEAIHDPGPVVMGMMEDMGWTVDNNGGGECELTSYLLVVDPDCYGNETTWTLEQVGIGQIASGGPYQQSLPNGQVTEIIDLCLEDGCYQLIINDSFEDGLAGSLEAGCDVDGDIYVLDQNGAFVVGIPQVNFGAQTILDFCVGEQEECTPGEMGFIDLGCQDQGQGNGPLPALDIFFAFTGDCLVEELCLTTNTGGNECYDLLSLDPPLIVENGDGVSFTDLNENTLYTFTYTLTNGETGGPQSFQTQSCSVAGCTDPAAINYNPNATIDDGSCEYNCAVTDIELSQNCFDDEGTILNRILVEVDVVGGCLVETVCYQPLGTTNETCFSMSANDIELGDGDGVFIPVAEGPGTYEVWVETEFGAMSLTEIVSIDCTDAIPVCNNPFAVNYDPNGTFVDNSTCIYDDSICDCDGNQHTIGAMAWLGDDYLDEGGTEFLWDGQTVNFNCLTWGFDCGDGGVTNDPNGVCAGNLPPNNGCDGATCAPLGLIVSQEPCITDGTNPVVVIGFEAEINGGCLIEDFCLQVDGGGYNCFNLPTLDDPLLIGDGDGFVLNNTTPGAFYEFYYTTDDGTTSPIFTWLNGDCSNEPTICDCAGTQHNIGVLAWLGDGAIDNGGTEFLWDGQAVDFDCVTWGFDCGDGGVTNDPNGVCNGNLPPNNGCVAEVLGCTDPTAINYNPSATVEDGSCIYDLLGCTDPTASNYNPDATINDGSCIYDVPGCTDPTATNYNPAATVDDGSCVYPITGCTNPNACNYNELAVEDDGSCEFDSCAGCTNQNACNYDASATIDDGSCEFDSCAGCINPNACNYDPSATLDDGSCEFETCAGCTDIIACNFDPSATISDDSCEYESCAGCTDPEATNYDVTATIDDGSCVFGPLPGCTDPTACNYNQFATVDDGSCDYLSCLGCTDAGACNYDPTATVDDGSCEFDSCAGCTDSGACNYDATATIDDGSCDFDSCAGCTDAEACNYDATATIDDGSCEYDSCAGCTDSNAINYDPDATIDDGSCVYDCEYPTLTWESVDCDEALGTFYVDMAVTDLGNGAPYSVTNNVNADEISLNFNGTVQLGPFNIGDQVLVTVTSEIYPGCFLTSPVMTCTNSIDELAEINYSLFPNPANDEVTVEFDQELQLQTIEILDQSGRMVKSFQDERAFAMGLVRVNLTDLSSGVYTFRLIGQKHAVNARVMINH